MIEGLIWVKRVVTEDDLNKLRAAALADGHFSLFPTHSVHLHGEIVGSVAVMSIPLVTMWAHSSKLTARATRDLVNIAENLGREKNSGRPIVTMCSAQSPIFPYMEKMGFTKFGETTIFLGEGGKMNT